MSIQAYSPAANWSLNLPVGGTTPVQQPVNQIGQAATGIAQALTGVVQAVNGVAQGIGGVTGAVPVQAVSAVAPAATATVTPPGAVANPWAGWNGKGQMFDYAYDAYAFSKFPLSLGGPGFWGGGPIRRKIAAAFSKVGEDRLYAYALRAQFMKVPGMDADSARLLEMAYVTQTNGQAPMNDKLPLRWLAQFGGSGTLNDWMVRGPLILTLGTEAAQCAVTYGFIPNVPGNDQLRAFGDAAMKIAPPVPGAVGQG